MTFHMVESIDWAKATGGKFKLLKVITEPFTKNVIQVLKDKEIYV